MEKERLYTYATRESSKHSYVLPIKNQGTGTKPITREIETFSTSDEATTNARKKGLEFVIINLAEARGSIIP